MHCKAGADADLRAERCIEITTVGGGLCSRIEANVRVAMSVGWWWEVERSR